MSERRDRTDRGFDLMKGETGAPGIAGGWWRLACRRPAADGKVRLKLMVICADNWQVEAAGKDAAIANFAPSLSAVEEGELCRVQSKKRN